MSSAGLCGKAPETGYGSAPVAAAAFGGELTVEPSSVGSGNRVYNVQQMALGVMLERLAEFIYDRISEVGEAS